MRFPNSRSTPGRVVGVVAVLLAFGALASCEKSGTPQPQIESTAPPSPQAVHQLVGPGCAAYTKKYPTGPGSVAEMADQPVGDAIEDHPMLTQFATAINGEMNEKVKLVDEMDSGEFTVFAPVDAAFRAKVPQDWARTLGQPKNADTLTDVLLFHLVVGQRSPNDLRGNLETRGGQTLAIGRDGDRIRIADQANVICGGLHTANGTVYLIDSVLMPPKEADPGAETPTPTPTATP